MRSPELVLVSVEELREERVLPGELVDRSLIELVFDVSVRRVVSVAVVDDVVLGVEVAALDDVPDDDGLVAELRLLIEPLVELAVLPLGAVWVFVLGPGVSFADGGFVFLPVSLTAAPEVLGEVVVCA